jgi:hypothetical protein
MSYSYRFGIHNVSTVAKELAEEVALATNHEDKQDDIEWALHEILGNIKHAPNEQGIVELKQDGSLLLTNCAYPNGISECKRPSAHIGLDLASTFCAKTELSFCETEYGCWKAVTEIGWDFEAIEHPVAINFDNIEF